MKYIYPFPALRMYCRYVFLVVDGVDRGPASVLAALSTTSPTVPTGATQFPVASSNDMSPEEEALQAFSRREVRRALDELCTVLNHIISVDGVFNRARPTCKAADSDPESMRNYRSMSAAISSMDVPGTRLPLPDLLERTKKNFLKLKLKVCIQEV